MNLLRLILREILYRKLNFALALVAVVLAVACLVAQLTLLRAHDIRTDATMHKLEDDIRQDMKKLGFNILILPKDQNLEDLYATDYASKFMPEDYSTRLRESKIMTVRHIVPSLRQKIEWTEQGNRVAILVGVRGEVPLMHRRPREPMLYPVPPGTLVLGYHLHHNLGLKKGDRTTLLGREFTVHKCHTQRGNKDDIGIWINLEEAQEMLDKKGLINEILALKCHCMGVDVGVVRTEVARTLPDTQIVEVASKALTRAAARDNAAAAARATRQSMEDFAGWLVPLVAVACVVLIGFLTFTNVRERLPEIGILRALGLRSLHVFLLFLGKAIIIGLAGAAVGYALGFVVGILVGRLPAVSGGIAALFNPSLLVLVLALAPFLAGLASWIPATIAAQRDPAEVLRDA